MPTILCESWSPTCPPTSGFSETSSPASKASQASSRALPSSRSSISPLGRLRAHPQRRNRSVGARVGPVPGLGTAWGRRPGSSVSDAQWCADSWCAERSRRSTPDLLSLERCEAKLPDVKALKLSNFPAAAHDALIRMRTVRQQQMAELVRDDQAHEIGVVFTGARGNHPQAGVEHVCDATSLGRCTGCGTDHVLRRSQFLHHLRAEHE